MTQETTSFVYVTYIRVTSEKVFEAITRPDIARRYWGHENVSDWTPGCRWEHVRSDANRTVELVGEVVEHTPPGVSSSVGPTRRRPTIPRSIAG